MEFLGSLQRPGILVCTAVHHHQVHCSELTYYSLNFSADSSSHHQNWWNWMLMPQSFYNSNGGSRRTGYSPTTQYPYSSSYPSYQYPGGSVNGYFSSYKPYNRNPSNSYYISKLFIFVFTYVFCLHTLILSL